MAPLSSFTGDAYNQLLAVADSVGENGTDLGLSSTGAMARWIANDYRSRPHTRAEARSSIEYLTVTFEQELAGRHFFNCDADHARYMRSADTIISNPPCDRATALAFSLSLRDMMLAGNCIGCGFHDAAVFHLMRVLEKGLAALAAVFSEAFERENWHAIIERVESKIRAMDAASFGTDWREKKQFYSEVACEFMFFKEAWRNHVMHGRTEYDDERARNIYDHVVAFMQRIARGGLADPSSVR